MTAAHFAIIGGQFAMMAAIAFLSRPRQHFIAGLNIGFAGITLLTGVLTYAPTN